MDVDVLSIAHDVAKVSRTIRATTLHLNVDQEGEIQTMRYCGAMLSLVASTLTHLHDKLHPVFAKDVVNGILRVWGEEDLL